MDPKAFRDQLAATVNKEFNQMVTEGTIDAAPIPVPEPLQEGADAETPPAPKEAPTASEKKEKPKAEKEPLIFGKYKNLEEAERGYYNAVNTLSPALEENKRLKEQFLTVYGSGQPTIPSGTIPPSGSSPGASPRVNPAARSNVDWKRDEAVAKLAEDLGAEPDKIANLAERLYTEALNSVDGVVEARMAPIRAQAELEAYMQENHPDSYKFKDELANFIQTADPVTKRTIQTLVGANELVGAAEFAWTQFQKKMTVETKDKMQANAQVAEEERKTARSAAGLPSTGSGTPIHSADPNSQEPDPKMLGELAERARGGDQEAVLQFRRLTIGRMLPPQLRTWEKP